MKAVVTRSGRLLRSAKRKQPQGHGAQAKPKKTKLKSVGTAKRRANLRIADESTVKEAVQIISDAAFDPRDERSVQVFALDVDPIQDLEKNKVKSGEAEDPEHTAAHEQPSEDKYESKSGGDPSNEREQFEDNKVAGYTGSGTANVASNSDDDLPTEGNRRSLHIAIAVLSEHVAVHSLNEDAWQIKSSAQDSSNQIPQESEDETIAGATGSGTTDMLSNNHAHVTGEEDIVDLVPVESPSERVVVLPNGDPSDDDSSGDEESDSDVSSIHTDDDVTFLPQSLRSLLYEALITESDTLYDELVEYHSLPHLRGVFTLEDEEVEDAEGIAHHLDEANIEYDQDILGFDDIANDAMIFPPGGGKGLRRAGVEQDDH
jgi:hypothetical protein